MNLLASTLVVVVALLHLWFLVLEMFLWTTPYGRRAFGLTPEKAALTKSLAMNQGLYNGLLAAGLLWGLLRDDDDAPDITLFFLSCVMVAGLFGGLTANRKILLVQALPGAIAFALVWLANYS